jgi:CTP synthase
MQMMVIEFARNVLGLPDAHSAEIDPETKSNVIDLMESQKAISRMGGTMRLGGYACELAEGSRVREIYGTDSIRERHRHRYEFNNAFLKQFEQAGMRCSGRNPENNLVEIVELPSLKWFVGTQFHPEYSSTVLSPHPLFVDFIQRL